VKASGRGDDVSVLDLSQVGERSLEASSARPAT